MVYHDKKNSNNVNVSEIILSDWLKNTDNNHFASYFYILMAHINSYKENHKHKIMINAVIFYDCFQNYCNFCPTISETGKLLFKRFKRIKWNKHWKFIEHTYNYSKKSLLVFKLIAFVKGSIGL